MAAPERIVLDGGLVLRRWRSADARALTLAVAESFEHLRPWMPWATAPRLEEERAVLVKWEEEWDAGGELQYGLFLGPLAVGSIGLIPRIAPGGLEIGYWVHAGHTRHGYATSATAALTSMAFTLPGLEVVELGFTLVGEHPRPSRLPTSPAESGTYRIWRMTRDRWRPSGASLPPPSP